MTKEEKSHYRQIGNQITLGILDRIATFILIAIVIVLLLNWAGWWSSVDDTDKDKWTRSNVELITDYGTGVQYLYKGGALIPRLDKDGKIIIVKEK
jgi:hypothetical protein